MKNAKKGERRNLIYDIKKSNYRKLEILSKIDINTILRSILSDGNDINSKIKYYESNLESKVFLFSIKYKHASAKSSEFINSLKGVPLPQIIVSLSLFIFAS